MGTAIDEWGDHFAAVRTGDHFGSRQSREHFGSRQSRDHFAIGRSGGARGSDHCGATDANGGERDGI